MDHKNPLRTLLVFKLLDKLSSTVTLVICKIVLLDLVHCLKYKITICKLDYASIFRCKGGRGQEACQLCPLDELASGLD